MVGRSSELPNRRGPRSNAGPGQGGGDRDPYTPAPERPGPQRVRRLQRRPGLRVDWDAAVSTSTPGCCQVDSRVPNAEPSGVTDPLA